MRLYIEHSGTPTSGYEDSPLELDGVESFTIHNNGLDYYDIGWNTIQLGKIEYMQVQDTP